MGVRETFGWIRFQAEGDCLILSYRVQKNGGEWRAVEQATPIIWMPCRFGGRRPYFVCRGVINGIQCNRLVTKLYGAGIYFLCRHCYRLAYAFNGKVADERGRLTAATPAKNPRHRARAARPLAQRKIAVKKRLFRHF